MYCHLILQKGTVSCHTTYSELPPHEIINCAQNLKTVSTLNTKAGFFEMQVPMCQTALSHISQDSDMNQHNKFLLFTVTGNIKLTNGGMRALNWGGPAPGGICARGGPPRGGGVTPTPGRELVVAAFCDGVPGPPGPMPTPWAAHGTKLLRPPTGSPPCNYKHKSNLSICYTVIFEMHVKSQYLTYFHSLLWTYTFLKKTGNIPNIQNIC